MLRLSKKSDYAVLLLSFLARQEWRTHGPRGAATAEPQRRADLDRIPTMSAAELAEISGLGRSVVANLLKEYGKAGILESVRGPAGGYRLARPASTIHLREILGIVEGPINFVECAEEPGDAAASSEACGLSGICLSKGPLRIVHNRIVEMLEAIPLSDLARFDPHTPFSLPPRRPPAAAGKETEDLR